MSNDVAGRAKHWCITINNYVDEDKRQFENSSVDTDYFVYGEEVGASGNRHLQCYIAFHAAKRLGYLKQRWPRGHFEIMRGKPEQAAEYCKKGEQSKDEWEKLGTGGPNFGKNAIFIESGVLPAPQPAAGGEATKRKWSEIRSAAQDGRLEDIDPQIYVTHYRNLKQIKFDNAKTPAALEGPLENEWIWGESGIGKSMTARKENPIIFDKMCNKWWDHYNGEAVILLDDFGKEHECLAHHLKRWADRYSFPVEIKNHVTNIRPQKIVVTSQYKPEDIFKDTEVVEAIRRRFKIRHLEKIKQVDTKIKKPLLIKKPGTNEIVIPDKRLRDINDEIDRMRGADPSPVPMKRPRMQTCPQCCQLMMHCKCIINTQTNGKASSPILEENIIEISDDSESLGSSDSSDEESEEEEAESYSETEDESSDYV